MATITNGKLMHTGAITLNDGTVIQPEMAIDMEALFRKMAARSARSKNGRAAFMDGLVKSKLIGRSAAIGQVNVNEAQAHGALVTEGGADLFKLQNAVQSANAAALRADSVFQAELVRVFGKSAGDMRYQPSRWPADDSALQIAARNKHQADEAMNTATDELNRARAKR